MKISIKVLSIILFIFLFSTPCFAQNSSPALESMIESLLLPAIIAAVGYALKSIYEAFLERAKSKRSLLEEKLKKFYWPILTRLEENNSIWQLMLSKGSDMNDLEKSIAKYVEEKIILKNHREIMSIVINNRYLAKFDLELSNQLGKYIKHVAIYEGIIESKVTTFPAYLGAPYPTEFDKIIKERTERLQKRLDQKKFL